MLLWFFISVLAVSFICSPLLYQALKQTSFKRLDIKKDTTGAHAPITSAFGLGKPPAYRAGGVLFIPAILLGFGGYSFLTQSPIALIIWLWLAALFLFAFLDDYGDVGKGHFRINGWVRLLVIYFFSVLCAWALNQHGIDTIHIGSYTMDFDSWFILVASIWLAGWYTASVIDALDGLTSTLLGTLFVFLFFLSLWQGVIIGVVLSLCVIAGLGTYLFYNIEPARVYMTETGVLPLFSIFGMVTLINSVEGFSDFGGGIPFALCGGIIFIITTASSALQMFSKKILKRKLFIVAPMHFLFIHKGFSQGSIVLYYWVVTLIGGVVGILYALGLSHSPFA
ncbi:MAG: hypothetical protein QM526_02240 [Alphaproteobacteria bacterium]|nr:hypothetical protein [Alphaproteobacteria bacterium]